MKIKLILLCLAWQNPRDLLDLDTLRAQILQQSSANPSRITSYQVTGKYSVTYFSGTVGRSDRFQILRDGDRIATVFEKRSSQPPERTPMHPRVEVYTPDYAFQLRKNSDQGPYLILNHGVRKPDDDTITQSTLDATLGRVSRFEGKDLRTRFESDRFHVESIVPVAEDGRTLYRVTYRWDPEDREEAGSFDLDPTVGWAIRRSEVVTTSRQTPPGQPGGEPAPAPKPLRCRTEVEYQRLPDGTPFPKRTYASTQIGDTSKIQVEELVIDDVKLGPPPDSVFQLSGYGLPDLPLTPRPKARTFAWSSPWLWGSLGTALVAFGLLRYLRRREAVEVS